MYRFQYVWLRIPGGVAGWELDKLNEKIREYNRFYYRFSDFWEWLSWDTGESYSGFSAIWNDKNPLMAKVLTIRAEEKEVC